jgi:2-polyprenyl-3-methyl-5-hydroxy-6-metoxy-1,4-benzoquinol methylase
MTKHTGASNEGIAGKYAAVDNNPWNACYGRPATLALPPALAHARVVDVGCGSGWYAQ